MWEMAAKKRWGEKGRWRVVIAIEAMKFALRYKIFSLTHSRLVVQPPVPERDVNPSALNEEGGKEKVQELAEEQTTRVQEVVDEAYHSSSSTSSADEQGYKRSRTGASLLPLRAAMDGPSQSGDKVAHFLFSQVLTVDDVKHPMKLLRRLQGSGKLAEILHIIRPLVYAILAYRYTTTTTLKGGRTIYTSSWKPWLIGLSLEYASRQLAQRDFERRVPGGFRGMTSLEKTEYQRRAWAFAWWALRGAFYENITKNVLDGVVSRLENKPILSMAAGILEDYKYLWEAYYFSSIKLRF